MRLRLLLIGLLILVSGVPVFAQGNLNYGDNVVGTISATSPLVFYTFSGTTGDLVTIQVIGITPGLDPAASLNSPTQQQLANNDNDPTSAGSTDARITYTLPQTGIYTVLVSSVTGANGDFLIRLSGQQPAPATALADAPLDVAVIAGQQPQVFSFEGDPANPLTLTVSSSTEGFRFRVVVRDPNGETVALLTGSTLVGLNLPAGSGTYTVEISPLDPNTGGQITVSVGATAAAPAQAVQPPVATEEASAPPDQDTTGGTVCEVGAQGSTAVNVRSGPGTDFDAIAQIVPGSRLEVTGYYTTWYQVAVPGIGPGWVRQDVVVQFGPCDVVPAVDAPDNIAPPVQTEEAAPDGPVEATPTYTSTAPADQQQTGPTATYTPTATTAQQQNQPTATYTPTTAQEVVQPTATYTPSYTPTVPVPTAPPDANFNSPLNIPLDSTASVTDFVSYPGGDREDRVRWDISGMNPTSSLSGGRARLILVVSCFGTGTQNITFFTGGQTYSCGQTIVDREVTADSRTGQVTITAVGGENTYVQWVLTGTATRVN